MTTVSIAIASYLLSMAGFQAIFGFVFARLLRNYRPPALADEKLPYCSVLLSLRGADPYLGNGLRRLMSQNYPHYDLRIVVDHREDPAWEVVERTVDDTGFEHVQLSLNSRTSDCCSLKCNALVQLAESLDDRTEVVVLADADLVSHDDWLRELVAPLLDEGVGAAHGNRWFWPQQAGLGSLVRFLWNVAAVVPMYVFQIPWGGSFAIRASILRDSGLLDKWSKAVVEDAPVRSAIEQQGLKIHFVPGLMMVNREDCTLPFSLDFVKRQLTWTKIYHPRWAPVVAHAFLTTAALAMGLVMAATGVALGNPAAGAISAAAVLVYLAGMIGLIKLLDNSVRHVVASRDEPVWKFSTLAWAKMIPAILLTQCVHMVAVLLAIFRKRVKWRGVTYLVRGPWDVQMLDYQPYEQPSRSADSNLSL